jgi:HEAT repeat protein
MPLVKRGNPTSPAGATPAHEGIASYTSALANPDPDTRWNAARALGARAEAVPALAAALSTEGVPRVREAIMTALMRVGDNASVAALLPYMRSQDASVRSSAIEALQALPDTIQPFMARLFQDDDTDVRILASELARNLPADDATQILCALLQDEQHANVCAAAIDVLAEIGTPAAVPVLRACAQRFSQTPFLPFAVSLAIARITGPEG